MSAPLPLLDVVEALLPRYAPRTTLGAPEGDGWFRVADLADAGTGQLQSVLHTMADNRGYPDPRTIGVGFALIASPAVAGLVWRAAHQHALPDLSAERVWWRLTPYGNVAAVALSGSPGFVEPAALGTLLHHLLDDLMDAIHAETGFPVRGQWSLLASALSQWLLDWMPDDHPLAVALVETVLASDPMLARGKPRITWLEAHGMPCAYTTRKVCCFNYRGRSGAYCSSQCPLVPPEERLAHAMQQFATR